MPSPPSYYNVLGLPKDATPEEVRRAYRDLSRIHHPDINHQPGANTQFLNIQEAYENLSDTFKRKVYDVRLVDESDDPVLVDILYSRSKLPVLSEPQLLYTLLDFSAAAKFAEQINPSLNLCIILDRSTSMRGARLDTVKSAAIEVLRQTRLDDVISLVTYSDRAEVLLSAARQHDRKFVETQIQLIHASGGTEIFQGLEAGYQQLQRNLNRALVNHIILITDGHTYGDEKACLEIANRAGAQGVRITALGIGTEWNDSFLDELSNITGGSTVFISKTDDLRKMMQSKFANLNQVFGERVVLKLDTAPGVTINSVFRLHPDPTHLGTSGEIRLGNILKSDSLGVLLEFIVQPNEEQGYRRVLAIGCLELILPFNPSATQSLPIHLSLVNGEPEKSDRPPAEIVQALTSITLYRMQARAREEVADGKTEEASKRLQHMATQLMSLGEDELAHTALMEVERIQQTNMLSAEGEKLIKYATRALLLPAWTRKGE